MAGKNKFKLKSKRAFLNNEVDSYYHLYVQDSGWTDLKLADCARSINWEFGRPGDAKAKKKIAVVKKLIDELYNHLHEIE